MELELNNYRDTMKEVALLREALQSIDTNSAGLEPGCSAIHAQSPFRSEWSEFSDENQLLQLVVT